MKLSHELTARGFIHQVAGGELTEIIDGPPRIIYHGIDPTADSATIGNFAVWLLLRHLADHGHTILFLVGGGTGRIGDPKPDVERTLLSDEQVELNVAALKTQAERILKIPNITFVNNHEWLGELGLISFLRDIGKHFTVNELIKKDAIASRLEREDGISYTEFAYPLLQGYDYLELYRRHQCTVQVGGSDQWGNIVAGVDLIRRKEQVKVYALTTPMVTDRATGKKFGKSEGNAVWLDPAKTSPYTFYQFWLNINDESVIDFLKLYTLVPLAEIDTIAREHEANPGARVAQQRLAKEVTTLVHGEEEAIKSTNVSQVLFGEGTVDDLGEAERSLLLTHAPTCTITNQTLLVEVLITSGLATSKREARTFIESGAITVNGEKVSDPAAVLTTETPSVPMLIKRGKKNIVIVSFTS